MPFDELERINIESLEKKPMKDLQPAELAAFNACMPYQDEQMRFACYTGFREGILFTARYMKGGKE